MALARRPVGQPPLPPLFEPTPANTDGAAEDLLYRATRDHRTKRGVRDELIRVWNRLGHLLAESPRQFVREFRRNFLARAWELYVLRWLAGSGLPMVRAAGHGPDFRVDHPQLGRIWIECVVPQPGEGPNRTWQRTTETVWSGPPDEPIQARYINGIRNKIDAVNRYRQQGIVAPTERVLIAMNQGAIRDSDLNDVEMPLAFEILFGLGETVLVENDEGRATATVETRERHVIVDRLGRRLPSRLFLDPINAGVAGLLLARSSTLDLFGNRRRRLYLAHNPLATARVPVALLPLRGELWLEPPALVHRGIVADYGKYAVRSRRRPTD